MPDELAVRMRGSVAIDLERAQYHAKNGRWHLLDCKSCKLVELPLLFAETDLQIAGPVQAECSLVAASKT